MSKIIIVTSLYLDNMTNRAKDDLIKQISALNEIAQQRKQTLAQMAIAWLLKDERTTSVLVGTSSPEQITENVAALDNIKFSEEELEKIKTIL